MIDEKKRSDFLMLKDVLNLLLHIDKPDEKDEILVKFGNIFYFFEHCVIKHNAEKSVMCFK